MPDLRPTPWHQVLRLTNRIRHRGAGEVLDLATGRIKDAWASDETLILLVRDAERMEREVSGLIFRRAEVHDAARYARDVSTDSATTFRSRLSDDVMCFIVEDGQKILHASWVTTSAAWAREVQALLTPPAGDAYVYESFTRADARGRGIYPFALAGMVTYLADAGIRRVWVGVESSNEPSRRAIAKAGFEEGFQIKFCRHHNRLAVMAPQGRMAHEASTFLVKG